MTLALINNLIENLNGNAVNYCHWKSNFTLAQSLSGEIDLDLLVDRQSLSQALNILVELGFKSAVKRDERATPSIYHYYGCDPQTGQLVHVHLFTRILTGESFKKSHWLPIENMLLDRVYEINQIKVPAKSAEMVLFILRTFIKYGSLLDLIYLVRKPNNIRTEFQWLLESDDTSESLALLKKYCPTISEQLFKECLDALSNESSLLKRIQLARRVRKQLLIYAVDRRFYRLIAYIKILWAYGMRRLMAFKKKKVLSAGGAVIAFVGPEATGKSTLVSETQNWLGQAFTVRTVHAGKPPSSWLTMPVNFLLPLSRRLLPRLRSSRIERQHAQPTQNDTSSEIKGLSGLVYALRAVGIAWDRRRLLLRARWLAANDQIIICDRYPSETIGAMDSPRLQKNLAAGDPLSGIFKILVNIENRLYNEIPPPDIVLRLKVSMEIAKQRNRDRIKVGKETDEYLEFRHLQSKDWQLSKTKQIYDVDTDQSLDDTILSVKKLIWEAI